MAQELSRPIQDTTTAFDTVRWFRVAGIATTVLIVVQAALAGRGFFVDYDLIAIHGHVGNVAFPLGLVLTWLALMGYRQGKLDRFDVVVSALVALLIVGQIGLGYGGRESTTAAALHWPNGVLITVLSALLLGRTLPRRD